LIQEFENIIFPLIDSRVFNKYRAEFFRCLGYHKRTGMCRTGAARGVTEQDDRKEAGTFRSPEVSL